MYRCVYDALSYSALARGYVQVSKDLLQAQSPPDRGYARSFAGPGSKRGSTTHQDLWAAHAPAQQW